MREWKKAQRSSSSSFVEVLCCWSRVRPSLCSADDLLAAGTHHRSGRFPDTKRRVQWCAGCSSARGRVMIVSIDRRLQCVFASSFGQGSKDSSGHRTYRQLFPRELSFTSPSARQSAVLCRAGGVVPPPPLPTLAWPPPRSTKALAG